jgi:hypothetical protein
VGSGIERGGCRGLGERLLQAIVGVWGRFVGRSRGSRGMGGRLGAGYGASGGRRAQRAHDVWQDLIPLLRGWRVQMGHHLVASAHNGLACHCRRRPHDD